MVKKKEEESGLNVININCDGDTYLTVLAIDFDENTEVEFSQNIIEQNHSIVLKPFDGELTAKNSDNRINAQGVMVDWQDTEDYMTWKFICREPGEYKVVLTTAAVLFERPWRGGHKAFLTVNDKAYPLVDIVNDGDVKEAGEIWRQAITNLGTVKLDKIGENTLKIKADYIAPDTPGFALVKLLLEKI